jgi:hypothetical protein
MDKNNNPSKKTTPEIRHFIDTEPQVSGKSALENQTDRSSLSALYPQPMTSEERYENNKIREKARSKKLPKHSYLTISLLGSILLAAGLIFLQNVTSIWVGGGMPFIFLSFAIWLVLFGLAIAWIKYVNKAFDTLGELVSIFWVVYIAFLSGLAVAMIVGWPMSFTAEYSILFLSGAHLMFLLCCLAVMLQVGRADG